jgi:hypothetical protein
MMNRTQRAYTRTGPQDFKHREFKIVKLFERKIENWFQNGHPMKSWITDNEGWYNRRENSAKDGTTTSPMSELRAQAAEAVKARRVRKAKTRTNQKYLNLV